MRELRQAADRFIFLLNDKNNRPEQEVFRLNNGVLATPHRPSPNRANPIAGLEKLFKSDIPYLAAKTETAARRFAEELKAPTVDATAALRALTGQTPNLSLNPGQQPKLG